MSMGLFDFIKSPDINEGVKICTETAGAVLLDVRNVEPHNDLNHYKGIFIVYGERFAQKAAELFG